MTVDPLELNQALDADERGEMPPNVPPGFLGEVNPDMRKVDADAHGDNAGLVQDGSYEVRLLWVMLCGLLVVTAPVALWLLWRDHHWKPWFRASVASLVIAWCGFVLWSVLVAG